MNATQWEDEFRLALPKPASIGASEYTALYDLIRSALDSALYDLANPLTAVNSMLDELEEQIAGIRAIIIATTNKLEETKKESL